MSCGVRCRRGLDPELLWLWRRPVATALIRPLAWEPPYAVGAALEKAKRQKKKKVGAYPFCYACGFPELAFWTEHSSDVWSIGCILIEYYLGFTVFQVCI